MRRLVYVALAAVTISLAVAASAAAGDANGLHNRFAHEDVRESPAAQQVLAKRAAALSANPSAAAGALKDSTRRRRDRQPRSPDEDRALRWEHVELPTGKQLGSGRIDCLVYVAAHAAASGLDPSGLASLRLRTDYVSVDGTHHLSYVQEINGLHVFGNGREGQRHEGRQDRQRRRLADRVGVERSRRHPGYHGGAGRGDLAPAGVQEPTLPLAAKSGSDAAQTTTFANGDRANLVYFANLNGLTLGWQTLIWGRNDAWQTVIDAASGKLLYRQTDQLRRQRVGLDELPGSLRRRLPANGRPPRWLNPGATNLTGPNVHVYSDVNDNNDAGSSEEVGPSDSAGNFVYPFTAFTNTTNSACSVAFPCSWDSTLVPGAGLDSQFHIVGPPSWDTNRKQNAVQVFFFVNNFHDHLAAAPIGFTAAAGKFDGNDALNAEPDDGADSIAAIDGIPSSACRTRTTPTTRTWRPRPTAPRRGCRCTSSTTRGDSPRSAERRDADPFVQANGGDEADVVYHEYTHGLSNRLVDRRRRQLDPRRHPGRRDGRGVERLVRDGLPRRHGPALRHRRPSASSGSATTSDAGWT